MIAIIDVTLQVQEVFGADIVQRAYIEDIVWNEEAKYNAEHRYNSEHPFNLEEDLDGEELIIEFVNDRRVIFGNSEWGWIKDANKE